MAPPRVDSHSRTRIPPRPKETEPAPAPKKKTEAPAPTPTDSFQPAAPAAGKPKAPAKTDAVRPDPTGPRAPTAYQLQKDLSATRQKKGEILEKIDKVEDELRGWHWPWTDTSKQEKQLKDLKAQLDTTNQSLKSLEGTEASFQPQSEVQKARYQVFTERLGELEKTHGKKEAASIARQTYYNDLKFNGVSLSLPLKEKDKLKAGLPTNPLMMTPKGEVVDAGHVAAAMDWTLNPKINRVVDLQGVTLVGDLAAGAEKMVKEGRTPEKALDNPDSGEARLEDLKGDIDGLNIANRLSKNPNASLTDTFKSYYDNVDPKSRLDELATHSPYFKKDEKGQYVVDQDALAKHVASFTRKLIAVGGQNGGGDKKAQDQLVEQKSREVARYFAENLVPKLTAPVE
ncbi:hypothetical protein [Myxococcus sp. RHSTA-1-4]|uniref:hypothetical protein n=1 Tax=Myxococcus sp. RHSTA-1-4 TaxID=2874601 RepID=UPI001CBA9749|nr:hypothetical protein [Myxococcus sp. RHSTA-1-4]MBZ4419229.1 hypothetical protein [Myxococcus sp. RHSTA-1-4]